jgi:hypothetical protein
MPRKSGVPAYRLHKSSGNAIVQAKGQRFYLGRYGAPESRARYAKFVANLEAEPTDLPSAAEDMAPRRDRH